jgi:hypothetical protein
MGGVSITGHVLDFVHTAILWRGEGRTPTQLPARDETSASQVERTKEKIDHRRGAEIGFFFSFAFERKANEKQSAFGRMNHGKFLYHHYKQLQDSLK